jgi:hypothetical protein
MAFTVPDVDRFELSDDGTLVVAAAGFEGRMEAATVSDGAAPVRPVHTRYRATGVAAVVDELRVRGAPAVARRRAKDDPAEDDWGFARAGGGGCQCS